MADRYSVIKTEIQTDPTSVGYAGQDAGTQAILVNLPRSQTPPVLVIGNFNPQEIVHVLVKQGKWQGIVASADVNAKNLVSLVGLGNIAISPEETQIKTLITNLVTAGLLTAADVTAIRQFVQTEAKLSRADILQLGAVSQGDVEKALL